MSEIINSYSLDTPSRCIPMDRKEFYEEQVNVFRTVWFPTKAVEVINILLFNESWEIILQKRSSHKWHNANLIDKAVGWHIVNWDAADFTVMVETVQELQVPSIVLKNHIDFLKTYLLLWDYTHSTAIVEYIDTHMARLSKIIQGEEIVIANKTHFYMWVYGGAIKNIDKEAKGVLFYKLDELEEEIAQIPSLFTNDLKNHLIKYKKEIQSFIQTITNK